MNLWADTSLWSDGWPSQNIAEWIHFILLICCPRLKWWRTWCCGEFPLLASLRSPPFWAKPDPENPSALGSIFTQLCLSAPPELWPVRERPHWAQTRPLIPQLQEQKRTISIKLVAICVWIGFLEMNESHLAYSVHRTRGHRQVSNMSALRGSTLKSREEKLQPRLDFV